ncbi:MAG TPA: TRAM domain-containing protein [Candidatus Saccharimonadales bacterium]|nr:TRAM domain-containing protein [Candidatus Saccharimonadales bacterium]
MKIIDIVQTLLLLGIIGLLFYKRPEKAKTLSSRKGKSLILDSCALIDGRIVELANAGFINNELVIPKFVLQELQLLADGRDSQKRERARFGLDVANRLQENKNCDVRIDRTEFPEVKTTDEKLIRLAKKLSAYLYTTDYNLNKVATVEGVKVLNINELALSMRPVILPGEKKKVKIVQKGSGKGQGVGYLEDGTMVVVENAVKLIGSMVSVEISRYHQTESGRMIFANLSKKPD